MKEVMKAVIREVMPWCDQQVLNTGKGNAPLPVLMGTVYDLPTDTWHITIHARPEGERKYSQPIVRWKIPASEPWTVEELKEAVTKILTQA